MLEIKLLFLLVVANGAPVVATDILRERWALPADGGLRLPDGRRLLGDSCTLRGWIAALGATVPAAMLLGIPAMAGVVMALLAMGGDALSSFVKRRLGLAPGAMALGLDQVPESLFPLLGVRVRFGLDYTDIALLVVGFFVLDLLLSQLLDRIRIRKHPY
jgi:CDP-2,3-bis-(O-geranylgeranyl)-sn-glycerol synthase